MRGLQNRSDRRRELVSALLVQALIKVPRRSIYLDELVLTTAEASSYTSIGRDAANPLRAAA